MEEDLNNIETEIKIYEAKIRLQKEKNELEQLMDGTFGHYIYGLIKILDNPLLLLLCVLMFFAGYLLRGI